MLLTSTKPNEIPTAIAGGCTVVAIIAGFFLQLPILGLHVGMALGIAMICLAECYILRAKWLESAMIFLLGAVITLLLAAIPEGWLLKSVFSVLWALAFFKGDTALHRRTVRMNCAKPCVV